MFVDYVVCHLSPRGARQVNGVSRLSWLRPSVTRPARVLFGLFLDARPPVLNAERPAGVARGAN